MKLLSINAGSSSLKFKLYNMPSEDVLIYGNIDKIGLDTEIKIVINGDITTKCDILKNHDEAVNYLINVLTEYRVINSLDEINGIGHRVVNGAGKFSPEIVTDELIQRLEKFKFLSLVHMTGHIAGIKAFKNILPNVVQIVVYDTGFHYSIPKENFLYSLPYEWYTKYGVRKYGFHGISAKYITMEMEKRLNKKPNLIICHIGNGASITLVKDGKSFDNSMGFTANEGLMMGTRCGNIDYSVIPYVMGVTGMSMSEVDKVLNEKSGLLGIAEVSDNRALEELINSGDEKAILANEMYVNRIVDYIAKFYMRISDIDALVLCGGVGENAVNFREKLLSKLGPLGIYIEDEYNKVISKFSDINTGVITTKDSKIPCFVIPTDEELMIARETYTLIK
ncbi:MAG: acetate/propionate family kinase [Bacilli bacterium]|nr:acetate/propionate family kinase [Bacilli bacterium]